MEYHASSSQNSGKGTNGECYGVNETINERVKADAEHGGQSDTISGVRPSIADEGGDKPVEQMQQNKTGEQVCRSICIHFEGFWDDV